jgi:hypothetical protein
MPKPTEVKKSVKEHLIFEREVGGVDCELTVTCHPAKDEPAKGEEKAVSDKKADYALTPEQIEICDHATD